MAERLNVYFACAIRGEQGGLAEKEFVVRAIQDLGHNVLSEVFLGQDLNNNQVSKNLLTPEEVVIQDIDWVEEADVVVADVTRLSGGVGVEVGWKAKSGGHVVALCREDSYEGLSNMYRGLKMKAPRYTLYRWSNLAEIPIILEKELGRVK